MDKNCYDNNDIFKHSEMDGNNINIHFLLIVAIGIRCHTTIGIMFLQKPINKIQMDQQEWIEMHFSKYAIFHQSQQYLIALIKVQF